MPVWLSLLMLLFQLPDLIEKIKAILALIHKQTGTERLWLYDDLGEILHKHAEHCDTQACKTDLDNFEKHLIEKYG